MKKLTNCPICSHTLETYEASQENKSQFRMACRKSVDAYPSHFYVMDHGRRGHCCFLSYEKFFIEIIYDKNHINIFKCVNEIDGSYEPIARLDYTIDYNDLTLNKIQMLVNFL